MRFAGCRKPCENDRKFISTDACDEIPRVEHTHKPLGSDHQHFIAERMAEAVIDVLKFVNVQKQYLESDGRILAVFVDKFPEYIAEVFTIWQVGK